MQFLLLKMKFDALNFISYQITNDIKNFTILREKVDQIILIIDQESQDYKEQVREQKKFIEKELDCLLYKNLCDDLNDTPLELGKKKLVTIQNELNKKNTEKHKLKELLSDLTPSDSQNNDLQELESAIQILKNKYRLQNQEIKNLESTIKKKIKKQKELSIIQMTEKIIMYSAKYGKYISLCFPHYDSYIRLSVHAHEDVSKKLGLSLFYGQQGTSCTMPSY